MITTFLYILINTSQNNIVLRTTNRASVNYYLLTTIINFAHDYKLEHDLTDAKAIKMRDQLISLQYPNSFDKVDDYVAKMILLNGDFCNLKLQIFQHELSGDFQRLSLDNQSNVLKIMHQDYLNQHQINC